MNKLQWIAGWIPAIILPLSTFLQLMKIVRSKSGENVSVLSWFLFGLANIGAYIFSGKFYAIQSVLAFLLSAFMDFIIVWLVIFYKNSKRGL